MGDLHPRKGVVDGGGGLVDFFDAADMSLDMFCFRELSMMRN